MRRGLLGMCLIVSGLAWGAEPSVQGAPEFARVEGVAISQLEFQNALRQTFRERFYHFNPPDTEKEKVAREVGQKLIDQILLGKELDRKNIQPDMAAVDAEVSRYEAQYQNSPQWKNIRDQALPELRKHLVQKSRLGALEKQVKTLPDPDESVLKAFYQENTKLFTEPEQVHISLIMLKVSPSSPTAKWDQAHEQGEAILKRLKNGEAFADLAKALSQDQSAAKGGDMGYLHKGMLPEAVQKVLDELKPGELSPAPIRVLEGVALVRLEGRKISRLRGFDEVRKRAADLWLRQETEKVWNGYLAKLRGAAQVKVNEDAYKFSR